MPEHVFVCGMSRSGTTLLTTILDSHSAISMGYEMLPANLPDIGTATRLIQQAIQDAGPEVDACARYLQEQGQGALGTFVRRCARTLVQPAGLLEVLEDLKVQAHSDLTSLEMRAALSMGVVRKKQSLEQTTYTGFKLNAPSLPSFWAMYPNSFFACIVRDPRDVVASHIANEFDRTIGQITQAWLNYTTEYLKFLKAHPESSMLIRYEDLVTSGRQVIAGLLTKAGILFDEQAVTFYNSKASVHQHGHVNAGNLKKDFFDSSINRWITDLSDEQVREVEKACGALMSELGYRTCPMNLFYPLTARVRAEKQEHFQKKKVFYRDQYGALLEPFAATHTNLTLQELADGRKAVGEKVLVIRHDIDHDLATACKIAKWECERGIRATYCFLHSAWYYGEYRTQHSWFAAKAARRFWHTTDLLDAMKKIQDLGHEICLHNNLGVLALTEGIEPEDFLEAELTFLRRRGINIIGTAMHGDALCRKLNFRNREIFVGRSEPARGGDRIVTYEGRTLQLGKIPMQRYQLRYEAYDFPRDIYLSESGGRLGRRLDAPGLGGVRRVAQPERSSYAEIVGVLTHPIWWNFDQDAPPGTTLKFEAA